METFLEPLYAQEDIRDCGINVPCFLLLFSHLLFTRHNIQFLYITFKSLIMTSCAWLSSQPHKMFIFQQQCDVLITSTSYYICKSSPIHIISRKERREHITLVFMLHPKCDVRSPPPFNGYVAVGRLWFNAYFHRWNVIY